MVSRLDRPNPPCVKKERNFKEVLIDNHSQQIFSADFFSRSSQQIFSADFLQQIFSADVLSRSSQQIFSQQIFSADLLSRFFQQIFSADLLSRFSSADPLSRSSQQIFSADFLSADFLSRSSQQIFSADFLSRSSQQIFSADLLIVLSFAVVRGWWSAIVLSFLSFAVVRGWWSAIVLSFAVVRGWWSAIVLSCWWSILHEFFRRTLSRSFRELIGSFASDKKSPKLCHRESSSRVLILPQEITFRILTGKQHYHHFQKFGTIKKKLTQKQQQQKQVHLVSNDGNTEHDIDGRKMITLQHSTKATMPNIHNFRSEKPLSFLIESLWSNHLIRSA